MNTAVWGPCAWRVLHGVAHSLGPDVRVTDPHVQSLIGHLNAAMPCKLCRDSFTGFRSALDEDFAKKETVPTFAHWLYDAHNLVNNKLQYHNLDPECLRKRLVAYPRYWSLDDLYVLLGAMAAQRSWKEQARATLKFIESLGTILAGLPRTDKTAHDVGVRLLRFLANMETAVAANDPKLLLKWVYDGVYGGEGLTALELNKKFEALCVFRSTVCTDKACR